MKQEKEIIMTKDGRFEIKPSFSLGGIFFMGKFNQDYPCNCRSILSVITGKEGHEVNCPRLMVELK